MAVFTAAQWLHLTSLVSTSFTALPNIPLVTILPYKTINFFDLRMTGPALEVGMEEISIDYPDFNFTMEYIKMPQLKSCSDLGDAAPDLVAKTYYRYLAGPYPVAAWFGPGCSAAAIQLATLAKRK